MVLGAGFIGDGVRHAPHQRDIESRRQSDGLRKNGGRAGARHAVQAFIPPVVGGHTQALDAGRGVDLAVPLEAALQLSEGHQLLDGEVAALGEDGVEDRRGVALAEDEAVAVRPVGALGVVAEDAKIESAEDLDGGEGTARVAAARLGDHGDDVPADAPGSGRQLLNRIGGSYQRWFPG